MLKNSSKMLFIVMVIMGTIITFSSNSWLGSWMGLEMNLLAFIPLMANTKNMLTNESSLKYFLVQALASAALLMSIILFMLEESMNSMTKMNILITTIMMLSLFLSSGVAPFHFWFPGVMEGLSWWNSLMLMTWQKLGPMMMISYIIIKPMITPFIVSSIIIGSLGGLNQTSLRKLMAFSSINHMGWMLTALMTEENLWLFYFVMYSILTTSITVMFNNMNIFYYNQMFNSVQFSKIMKFMLFMNLLSLGGLPPFTGFMPKLMVIQQLIINGQMMLMVMLTIFTLITLFFYLRMTFSAFMISHYENNWTISYYANQKKTKLMMMTSFISICMLPLISLIYSMT